MTQRTVYRPAWSIQGMTEESHKKTQHIYYDKEAVVPIRKSWSVRRSCVLRMNQAKITQHNVSHVKYT